MAEVSFTARADRCIDEIFEFHASRDVVAALRIVSDLYEKTQLLREFPLLGQRYLQEPDREVRVLVHGSYRIFYLIKAAEKVDVLAVYHERMDVVHRLREDT